MTVEKSSIRLLLADVDGTLVTKDKILTDRARESVQKLNAAGILFAITSGRPPKGMEMVIAPLGVIQPIAGYNGGVFTHPDMSIIEQHTIPDGIPAEVVPKIEAFGLDVWIYRGNDWYVRDKTAPHVEREEFTVHFPPQVVPNFDDLLTGVVKIVGVSDDGEAVAKCEAAMQAELGERVSATRSQPYYLDVTNRQANKGTVVTWLAARLNISPQEIATIGDMPNDVLMFRESGMSIAMGNASPEVQEQATYVTTSNEDEGFANAIEKYLL